MSVLLRFLATGDFQVHNWKQFSITLPNGMNSRLANCLKVFQIVRREAKARGITKFLANGDIFEETDYINVEVYDAVYKELEKCSDIGMETAINLGNHDICSESGGRILHSLRPFRKVARVLEEPTRLWYHLQVVPYMENPSEFKKAVADLAPTAGLVLHCGVQGATTGPTSYLVRNPIKLKDVRPKDFRLVLLSDYHTSQWLRNNVFYLGSPLQHTFGEIHKPAIWDVTLYDREPYYRLVAIPTNLPSFRRIKASTRRQLTKQISRCCGDYVRVIVPEDSTGLSDAEVDAIARRSGCLYQIERQGDEVEDAAHENAHALEPVEAMTRYVKAHIDVRSKRRRLIGLGRRLYEGGRD